MEVSKLFNTRYNMLKTPPLRAMGFVTRFSSQVFAGTGSELFETRAKPVDVRASVQTFYCMDPLLPGQFHISVHASLPVYIYPWPRCCFSTASTSSPVLRTLKLKERIFPPSTCVRWQNEFKLVPRAKAQKPGVFSKPAYVCPYAYAVYVLCLTKAYSKQLSLTFTPSANTFLNP